METNKKGLNEPVNKKIQKGKEEKTSKEWTDKACKKSICKYQHPINLV